MRKFLHLKFIIALTLSFLGFLFSYGQQGEWTWIHGSMTAFNTGNFGVQGIPSPANEPPGVYEACEWSDQNGNFWIFGGYTSANFYNDLWKYDPVLNEWTWVKGPGVVNDPGNYGTMGVSSPANNPPSRASGPSWTDNQGNLWMFGGFGGYSDLWKFDVGTSEWTWIKGPTTTGNPGTYGTQGVPSTLNDPAGRWETAVTWTDAASDLWLFGGNNSTSFNDLWRYHIATDEWTWMQGSQSTGAPAVYGTKGIEDPLNTPGARMCYSKWKDLSGNFWLFGGSLVNGSANDLWRYNPSTNNWAWISGSNTTGASGFFGTRCSQDSLSVPSARWENRSSWIDPDGNFWMFGGSTLNDLWKYCVAKNEWTWVSGDSVTNAPGNWGILGVSDPANKPDARFGSTGGTDNSGNLYMFGGYNSVYAPCNDLWRFKIDTSCAPCTTVPVALFNAQNHICPGTCTDFHNLSLNATSYQWAFAGGSPSSSTNANPTGICYSTPGTYDVELIAFNSNSSDTLLLVNFITVYPYPPPQGIIQSGDTLFSNQGSVSYQWYYNGNLIPAATNYFYVAPQSGDYNVVCTDAVGCEVEAVIFNVIAEVLPGEVNNFMLEVFPSPVTSELTIRTELLCRHDVEITIYNLLGEKIFEGLTLNSESSIRSIDLHSIPQSTYLIEVKSGDVILRNKFVKQ